MIIYKVTNIINGKIYIGQTKQSLIRRWKQHVNNKDNAPFHNAIRKYGAENFTVEQIDVACSSEELNLKEIRWISYYNSIFPYGYNMTTGGQEGKSLCNEARKKCGNSFRGKFGSKHNRSLSIICIETGVIYGSINEAERTLGIDHRNIARVLKGKRKTCGGYHWKYI